MYDREFDTVWCYTFFFFFKKIQKNKIEKGDFEFDPFLKKEKDLEALSFSLSLI